MSGGLVLAAVLAGASPAGAQTGTARQKSLYVSVVDRNGAPVTTVAPEDLTVREDGVAREILKIEPATEPMQIALLVDNSEAATRSIQFLRDALGQFVDRITAAGHRVSLVTLADRPTLVVNTTSDGTELRRKGTDRLFATPGSGTYLLDAIVDATKGFSKNEAPRPVIVAVTTEGTEFSNDSYERVLELLGKGGILFHAIVLTEGPKADPSSNESRNRSIVLDRGTRENGGDREIVISNQAIAQALTRLATVLNGQQKVTYASPDRLIPPEKIRVEARTRGLTARGLPARTPAP